MAQVSKRRLSSQVEKALFETLLRCIVELKHKPKALSFLNTLLSPTEKIMLSKRIAVALMLKQGYSYEGISHTVKVSYGTIAKIQALIAEQSSSYHDLLGKLIREKKVERFFNRIDELLEKFSLPPRGGSWSEWGKKRWQKEQRRRQQPPF